MPVRFRDATHTVDLEELGGLQRRMPVTGTTFLIACCSIVGLPLFNGFISEWLTFRSFLAGSVLTNTKAQIVLPLMVGVLALIGGLAAACFVKVFGVAFLGRPRSTEAEHAVEVPVPMRGGMALLAAACLLIGILPGIFLRPLASLVQGSDSRRWRARGDSEHRSHHSVDRSDCPGSELP